MKLAKLTHKIISSSQRGCIHGFSIFDCIRLMFEAVNLLDKKAFRGKLALKIDIAKTINQ